MGKSASTATMCPTEAERLSSGSEVTADRAKIGEPSAPKETGALFARAATRSASRSAMPSVMSIGATTAHG